MRTRDPATVDVFQAPELQEGYLAKLLGRLVAVKSTNPGTSEREAAELVADLLRDVCQATFVESMPGRPSVAAVLRGIHDGPRLVLNGHLDTVPVDDVTLWSSDPFTPELRDGFVYGRGACDMKSGLAAQVAVARFLAQRRDRLHGTLVLHFAAGEECAEPGTLSLLRAGFTGDLGIVTEPTDLKVATAERGLAFYRIRINGRSIHASQAHLGVNPIPRLRAVLDVLQAYEDDIRLRKHALLPSGSCTPTILRAGVKENAVPDYCDIVVDRRLLPGETVDGEMETLRLRLSAIKATDTDFDFGISALPSYFAAAEIDSSSAFAARVANAVERVTGAPCEIIGTPYSSDVRNLINDAGMEAITFGPGKATECHCANERVSVAQLRDAARVLATVAGDLLLAPSSLA